MVRLPERYGTRTTCYNLFARLGKPIVWVQLTNIICAVDDGVIQMIDSTCTARSELVTAKGVQIDASFALKGAQDQDSRRGRRRRASIGLGLTASRTHHGQNRRSPARSPAPAHHGASRQGLRCRPIHQLIRTQLAMETCFSKRFCRERNLIERLI